MKFLPEKYNTIRFKISIIVGFATVLYAIIIVNYFNYIYKKSLLSSTFDNSEVSAKEYAEKISADIEKSLEPFHKYLAGQNTQRIQLH